MFWTASRHGDVSNRRSRLPMMAPWVALPWVVLMSAGLAIGQPADKPMDAPADAPKEHSPPADRAPDSKPAAPAGNPTPSDIEDEFLDDEDLAPSATPREIRAQRLAVERELKKLRHKHFGSIKRQDIRQEGIAKLRTYTDPSIFPALVSVFARERDDVRVAIIEHLVDQKSEEGDATLAWMAAFDSMPHIKSIALERLKGRIAGVTPLPRRIQYLIYHGLQSGREEMINGAAQLAENLGFAQAIPWLIATQFGGANSGGSTEREGRGDLAYIVVGTQTAFVSDLTPIVGDSAVAFDPQLSVLTNGTILRIQDAVVTTYRTIVHTSLVNLSSSAWGQSTEGLGYNGRRWWTWYREEYLPYVSARLAGESHDAPDGGSGSNDGVGNPGESEKR